MSPILLFSYLNLTFSVKAILVINKPSKSNYFVGEFFNNPDIMLVRQ